MQTVNEWYQNGLRYHQQGDLRQAASCYEQILRHHPRHPGAIHFLGVIALAQKNIPEAISRFETAISLCDTRPVFYNNYGAALDALGKTDEAKVAFEKAVQLQPDYADAWSNLGKLHLDHAEYEEAVRALHQAIRITPDHPDAVLHLISLFQKTDRYSEAVQLCFYYAEKFKGSPAFLKKIGGTLIHCHCYREALTLYRKLEEKYPGDPETMLNLGRVHGELGDFHESRKYGTKAADNITARPLTSWYHLKYCPAVFQDEAAIDEYWNRLEHELDALLDERPRIDWRTTARDGVLPSFHLAHHGRSCRPIRERFAAIYRDIFPQERPEYSPKSRIRVGFVTSPGNEGGLLRGKAGIIRNLDPRRFETVVFCTNSSLTQCRTEVACEQTTFVMLPDHFENAARILRETQCDILYYWKVEPGTWNPFFSMTRPAPVQCTGWGTYGTSGFDSIDYYLTTPLLEPENVDFSTNYVEKVEIFSTFPMYCLKEKPPLKASRSDFGLPEQGTLYFCPHRIPKYHPAFDEMLREILDQDPRGRIILMADRKQSTPFMILRDRMQKNLGDTLMRRVIFFENLSYEKYRSLLSLVTMVLDSPFFTGGYTAYDAFSLGIPMVTMTGPVNVQNFTAGFYHKLEMPEYINRSRDEYIHRAVRLSTDEGYRKHLSDLMLERREALFEEMPVVREFETFFENAVQKIQNS